MSAPTPRKGRSRQLDRQTVEAADESTADISWIAQRKVLRRIAQRATDSPGADTVERGVEALIENLERQGCRALPAEQFLDLVVTMLHQQQAPTGMGIELCILVEEVRNGSQSLATSDQED